MYFKVKKWWLVCGVLFCVSLISAQDDLLAELEQAEEPNYSLPAFKAMRICNLQSTKLAEKGDFYLAIAHRFGPLNEGIETLFGLDMANTKIQFLYGLGDNLQISFSRESYKRTYAGALKYRVFEQEEDLPLNLVIYGAAFVDTLISETNFSDLQFADRMSYVVQLLASRRFSKKLSLQIAPSYIRENIQDLNLVSKAEHNQFALGAGGRYKLSKRISVNAEYIYNFNRPGTSMFDNGYAFGMDIETGGHVFQLLFTNSESTNEPGFMSYADGQLRFGFNIIRVF